MTVEENKKSRLQGGVIALQFLVKFIMDLQLYLIARELLVCIMLVVYILSYLLTLLIFLLGTLRRCMCCSSMHQ
jgi:hypothetical protein